MSLENQKSVDIRTVKPEDVADIQQIKVDSSLTQQEIFGGKFTHGRKQFIIGRGNSNDRAYP